MAKIRIKRDTSTRITRHGDPNERWDGDDEASTHKIEGFVVINDDAYGDFDVSFDPIADKDYFLLYVIYDTGDSFSRQEGKIILLDLYQDRSKAEVTAKAIRQHYDSFQNDSNWDRRTNVPITYENGTKGTIYAQWVGHFESLVSVCVEPVRMGRAISRF